MLAKELASLLVRDLTRLTQEIEAFPDDETLWRVCPGITNPAGNLALHLEGNLREFIGRQLGHVEFTRHREEEFRSKGLPRADVVGRIRDVIRMLQAVVPSISEEVLDALYPTQPFGQPITSRQFLIHLHGHLNYHLGQIDYLRRFFTGHGAVEFAKLEP